MNSLALTDCWPIESKSTNKTNIWLSIKWNNQHSDISWAFVFSGSILSWSTRLSINDYWMSQMDLKAFSWYLKDNRKPKIHKVEILDKFRWIDIEKEEKRVNDDDDEKKSS